MLDWIKMRGALLDHPKVVAMVRHLSADPGFRAWLMPGQAAGALVADATSGAMPSSGEIPAVVGALRISDAALRCVTVGALLRFWSASRQHGKFVGGDLVLEHSETADVDQIGGVPGLGAAMKAVGWLENGRGITLRNFKEYNVPMTGAERQSVYRQRQKSEPSKKRNAKVTEPSSQSVTREEREKRESSKPIARTLTGARPGKEEGVASQDGKSTAPPLPRAREGDSQDSQGGPARDARDARDADLTPLQIACRATWEAYCEGYERRWGAKPVRSATVNAHIKAFVQAVGMAEAPPIARWFPSHKRSLYVAAHHDTALLRRDANGLRTEWLTGQTQTDAGVRRDERTAARGEAFAELHEEAQRRESNG